MGAFVTVLAEGFGLGVLAGYDAVEEMREDAKGDRKIY